MRRTWFLALNLLILLTSTLSQDYNELYRPQIHYSPAKNWINDPNGLIFYNGLYHLYYQYNPEGNDWGNMSWGHATSIDLIHWEEQPVAIPPYELGFIFSGSCILDKDNTAGYGNNVIVAIYTACDLRVQQQAIAYSLNEGFQFTNYPGNPVIPNDDDNLRDPKVIWYEETKKWIMVLSKGRMRGLEFYSSSNLKEWEHLSTFFMDFDIPDLQWECPDLIQFDYNDQKKWVLIVNINPRGGVLGSGAMYFVGNFDGTTFTADPLDYPIWVDYGMDNYAGVTFSNTGERKILIGWMNNWLYAGGVPCSPWRSSMTLPRELKLIEYNDKPILANKVVDEIDKIAKSWKDVVDEFEAGSAYQLKIQISLDKNTAVSLSNVEGEKFVFEINAAARKIIAYRNEFTGKTDFNGAFNVASLEAPLNVFGHTVTLDIFVDQSSVEIFTENGSMSMTNLVFPSSIYNRLSVDGATFSAQMRTLKRIWN